MKEIYNVLKGFFKSLNNYKLESLAKAIICVAIGLRASHLVDIAYLDLKKATLLLNRLRKIPSCQSLVLVQFKDRFTFLCNKHRLKQHLELTLDEPTKWIYISVEGKEPVKTDPPMHLIALLQEKILPFINSSQLVYHSSILPTFLVAFTGWALEYPVIYTTHLITDDPEGELDEWEAKSNCLGSRTLNLVQIWVSDHMLLSFTFLLLTNKQQQEMENQLKSLFNDRLGDINQKPDWMTDNCIELRREQVKLDRFAL
ncbi:unnamed protein product [Mucor circinelloides]